MMYFFDYVFYMVYRFYSDSGEDAGDATAAGIVGGLEAMNLISALWIFEGISGYSLDIDALKLVLFFLFFQVFTFIRYLCLPGYYVEVIESNWLKKPREERKLYSAWLKFYTLGSVCLLFFIAVYTGKRG